MSYGKKNSAIVFAMVITGALAFVFWVRSASNSCPLPDYSTYHGDAGDLLILEGSCVVPTAIEAVGDRSLSKRSFVINFLGDRGAKDALPTLLRILEDETDPHRSNALMAVFMIDNEKGRELASKLEGHPGRLGEMSRDILENKTYLHRRRSYWQALRSYMAVKHAL